MMAKPRDITPEDVAVGLRIYQARQFANLTQAELAEKVGVCRQQIFKYEYGEDRITAGRLNAIAKILEVPIGFFFKDIHEIIYQPDTQELILQAAQSFRRIKNPEVQKELLHLLEVMNSKEI